METLLYNISQVLGITILHSLWQGLLIYAGIRLLLTGFPAASANKKYNILYCGLVTTALWFAYTFFMEAKTYSWAANQHSPFTLSYDVTPYNITQPATAINQPEQPFYYSYKQLIKTYLPYVSVLYLLSVVINLARLAVGWQNIRKIKKQATHADKWQPLADTLTERAAIFKHVQISFSNLVDVPCALGYLKPIVLLPVSISTQLSAEEIEVIILHELAHIKNNDYILNLIQQIMALLLFLNPFAQLLSRMIDLERENRCDDTVLQIGDPLTYAGALVKLEKTRQQNLQLALAATGKKYHLFARIQRIMGGEKPTVNIRHLVFGMLIFIGSLGSIAWLNPEIKNGKLSSKNGEAAVKQLAKMVKEVIMPHVAEQPVPENELNKKLLSLVQDSVGTPGNEATADSSAVKRSDKEALAAEYVKLHIELDADSKRLDELPESKQLKAARQVLDSLRRIRIRATITPEIEQEGRDMKKRMEAYTHSPEMLRFNAERKRLFNKYYVILQRQPEIIAYEEGYAKRRDSVRNKIMQIKGLTEQQLEKDEDWDDWLNMENNKEMGLKLKYESLPEIKVFIDSMETINQLISSSEAYLEFKKHSKYSQAYIDAMSPAGLEKYEAIVKDLSEKVKNSAEYKKYWQDIEKSNYLTRKLKQ